MQVHRITKLLTAAAMLAIFTTGCYYDNEEELYPEMVVNACDTSAVTFTKDIKGIIENNCATSGCHVANGSGNGDFKDYAGVMAKVNNGSLKKRVLIDKTMPPSQPLNECQLNKISAWLNAGAPE